MSNNHRGGNFGPGLVRGFSGWAGRGADHGANRGGNYQGGRGAYRGGRDAIMPRRDIDNGYNREENYQGSSGAQRGARGGAVAARPGRGDNGNFGRGRGNGGNYRESGDRPARGNRGRGRGPGDNGTFHGNRKEVIVYKRQDGFIPPPSEEVTEAENKFQHNVAGRPPKDDFPLRPGYGTIGQHVVLYANYFHLKPKRGIVLYRYQVDVKPEAKGKKRGQIVQSLLEHNDIAGWRGDAVTDFRSTIITCREIRDLKETYDVQYRSEGELVAHPQARSYQVKITASRSLVLDELVDYLCSTNTSSLPYQSKEALQGLNILLSHYTKSSPGIATIGASKSYDVSTSDSVDLGSGLKALRGFFSSVRTGTSRLLLNVNVSSSVFYQAGSLVKLISEFGIKNSKLGSFLKKLRIQTLHNKPPRRARTIFGLATPQDGQADTNKPRVRKVGASAREVSFFLQEKDGDGNSQGPGKYVSVEEYFSKTLRIQLSHPEYPVVNVGNKVNPIYLPPDVCEVMPGQGRSAKLNASQTRKMITFANQQGYKNANLIVDKAVSAIGLQSNENPALARFNMEVVPDLITVEGRVLPSPRIVYANSTKATVTDGSWNMSGGIKFFGAVSIGPWSYMLITDRFLREEQYEEKLSTAMTKLWQQTTACGMVAANRPNFAGRVDLNGPEDFDAGSKIEDVLKKAIGLNQKLMIVILTTTSTSTYNQVKRAGDVKLGVHTCCMQWPNIVNDRGTGQLFTNIAHKINLKLGGINHTLDRNKLGILSEDKTMVVGIDVTHPSPGSASNAPSVASMVASIDANIAQWPADIRIQTARQEMVGDLEGMLKARLELWKTLGNHQSFPENLLIYRDGVSEDQYKTVLDEELPQFIRACRELYPAPDTKRQLPRITIIIVGKRHHTRFFASAENEADKKSNPRNGTVVDRGMTDSQNWDFFLQSHSAVVGTPRSAHYYVIMDQIFSKRRVPPHLTTVADVVEELTHNMSHLYGRATKAVSICPPAYYADLVCDRARRYLSALFDDERISAQSLSSGGGCEAARTEDVAVHPNLKNTMFYM